MADSQQADDYANQQRQAAANADREAAAAAHSSMMNEEKIN